MFFRSLTIVHLTFIFFFALAFFSLFKAFFSFVIFNSKNTTLSPSSYPLLLKFVLVEMGYKPSSKLFSFFFCLF